MSDLDPNSANNSNHLLDPDDPYAEVAEWYDLEHDRFREDLECYTELLSPPGGGGRAMLLEVGAGTGRIAVALSSAGYEVSAVEPSRAMRRRAEARLAELPPRVARRIHIAAGAADNYGFSPERRFHAILFGLNTFAHLTSGRMRQQALSTAFRHLRADGRLLIDLDLAGMRRLLYSPGQLYLQGAWKLGAGEEESWVSHLISGTPGAEPGTLLVTHFYDRSSSKGELRRTIARMSLGLISEGELELAAATCGFETLAVYGGYDLAPYDDLSGRAILLARRPDSE
ncbi:MAG: class I SAM-dependent methyltransferase [Ktedonobacterales bacterium]